MESKAGYGNIISYEVRFNSLQTGRSMERTEMYMLHVGFTIVSIPFKREGAWKVKSRTDMTAGQYQVSIPFKREGAWKAVSKTSLSK